MKVVVWVQVWYVAMTLGWVKSTKVSSMRFYLSMMYEAGELVLREVSQFRVGLAGLEFGLCGRRGWWKSAGGGNSCRDSV